MEKTTLYLPSETQAALRELARRSHRSQATLIREAIERYVADQERPWPASIGAVSDGSLASGDVEAWLDEHLYAALESAAASGGTPKLEASDRTRRGRPRSRAVAKS